MKVAVPSQGPETDSAVDPRFGRARYFIVFETETRETSSIDNAQNLNAVQGAGIQAARNVIEAGAQGLIAGNVGPKAFAALRAAGVNVYAAPGGSVAEAFEAFMAGRLQRVSRPNVEGHWA
jgi:predicted Fe-Mo cluster-binding NifX family protein